MALAPLSALTVHPLPPSFDTWHLVMTWQAHATMHMNRNAKHKAYHDAKVADKNTCRVKYHKARANLQASFAFSDLH